MAAPADAHVPRPDTHGLWLDVRHETEKKVLKDQSLVPKNQPVILTYVHCTLICVL